MALRCAGDDPHPTHCQVYGCLFACLSSRAGEAVLARMAAATRSARNRTASAFVRGNCRRPPIAVPRAGQRRRRRREVRRRRHGSIRPGHRPAKASGHPSVRIARPPFVAVGRALQPVAAGAPPACTHLSTSAVPGRALGPARFRRSRTEPYLAPGSLHDDYGEQTTPPPWVGICHVTNQKCALVRYVTLPERLRGGRHSVGEEPDGLGVCPGVCA